MPWILLFYNYLQIGCSHGESNSGYEIENLADSFSATHCGRRGWRGSPFAGYTWSESQ